MNRIKLNHPLAFGLWHEAKVMARSCSAQSAVIGHRLMVVDRVDSALVGKWVEFCETATALDFELDCPEALLDQLDPMMRGSFARKFVREIGSDEST